MSFQTTLWESSASTCRALAYGACVAGVDNLAAQHRQLVAKNGDLDVLGAWFGTEADQPEDPPYNKEDEGGGHASHPGRCPSWLVRAAILYLQPSGHSAVTMEW
jgi:hypothetical protein